MRARAVALGIVYELEQDDGKGGDGKGDKEEEDKKEVFSTKLADITDMRRFVADGSIDLVLDKATIDGVWSDGGCPWNPSDGVRADFAAILDEVYRILRKDERSGSNRNSSSGTVSNNSSSGGGLGEFYSCLLGQPHHRLPLLSHHHRHRWDITTADIADTFLFTYHFVVKPNKIIEVLYVAESLKLNRERRPRS